jgi:transketolase
MALENTHSPTALILSRQNITSLPVNENRFESALQAKKGAYIVVKPEGKPEVVLVASGSEVATLVDGAKLLENDGLKVQVVSVPSEGLFRNQSKAYQQEVLPLGIPRFGMTAGLPVTLEGLVGENGKVWGLESFGFSAPYTVLDEKLGFNGKNVYTQVKAMLG